MSKQRADRVRRTGLVGDTPDDRWLRRDYESGNAALARRRSMQTRRSHPMGRGRYGETVVRVHGRDNRIGNQSRTRYETDWKQGVMNDNSAVCTGYPTSVPRQGSSVLCDTRCELHL